MHPEVPSGGEDDFRELRRVGEPRRFDFAPADHVALGEQLDLVDFEAGAKVAGQKFYFLKNEAVLLELALQRLALDLLLEEGFTHLHHARPRAAPRSSRRSASARAAPETQIYSIEDTDLDLIGTAEITLGGLHEDAMLEEDELPIKIGGISHCFRTEAGAARAREQGPLPRAPVHEGGDVRVHAPGGLGGDARASCSRIEERDLPGARAPVPRDRHRGGRPRRARLPQVRHRGVDARPRRGRRLRRGDQHLELHRLPGAPPARRASGARAARRTSSSTR